MARQFRIAAAQMGSTHYDDAREKTLGRMIALLDAAVAKGAQVVLFPETAFGTFFPRHLITDEAELDSFFEHGDVVTQPQTRPLFERARAHGVHLAVGFAEKTDAGETYNACIFYDGRSGATLSKYRKIHLPGDVEPWADPAALNQLEKRYFRPGNLGFQAFRVPDLLSGDGNDGNDPIFGMMICNDRRWAESWRVLGLQGVEVVLVGYNTPGFAPHLYGGSVVEATVEERARATEQALFQHRLVMQAHSYTNACFSVCAARAGLDDGRYDLIAGSCIVGPEGNILAEATTDGDEVVVADIDLDACCPGRLRTFDFARHRRVEHYGRITAQTGVIEPPRLGATANTIALTSPSPTTPPIHILVVNPNSTAAMTTACIDLATPQLAPDVRLTGFTAPRPAPSAIESSFDNVVSAAAAARALLPMFDQNKNPPDAVLVACYSDHALIRMLREELPAGQPVVGIMEASLAAARSLGARFGLIATSDPMRIALEDTVRAMGLQGQCAGVASCRLGVLDLHATDAEAQARINERVAEAARSLVSVGADVLTLGCAGMAPLKAAVETAVGPHVTVIDGVLAGVQHLSGLVRMGSRTAKAGAYRSSAATRKERGQDWI